MIIPAILENDFKEAERKIKLVQNDVKLVQIDVLDNSLVEGSTFTDLTLLKQIKGGIKYDIHFMVKDPTQYLPEEPLEQISRVCTQIDASHVYKFLEKARNLGYETGLSLNPDTPITALQPYMGHLNYVQFMTILPGGQGRDFHQEVLEKIREFKKLHPRVRVQADGGINENNLNEVTEAGAEDVVIGSAIFKEKKPSRKMNRIAFLGGASWEAADQAFQDAYITAKTLAENGYEIINGGGPGVMRAATIGAHDGGGKALAVTYHPNKPKKNFEGKDPYNTFDAEIYTLDYFDRTKVMLQNSDIHIVFNGSTGTISEFGMTWASSRIHEGNHKPIILYGNFWKEIIEVIKKNMYLRPGEEDFLKICSTPEEVLEYIKSLEDVNENHEEKNLIEKVQVNS